MTAKGVFSVDQSNNPAVFAEMQKILEARMARGETIIVDGTHTTAEEWVRFKKMADFHRYKIACLDFSNVSIDDAKERNRGRVEWRRVPEESILRMARNLDEMKMPDGIFMIDGSNEDEARLRIDEFLAVPFLDLNKATRIVHVGDIQGSATALRVLVESLGGIKPDDVWIFVGDILDRGPENGEALELAMSYSKLPNVHFLWGNHEDHIHNHVRGNEPVSPEFVEKTLPQIQEKGLDPAEIDEFCDRLKDAVFYHKAPYKVMVTHAGLAGMPLSWETAPWMVPSFQYSRGSGYYEDPIDQYWDANAPPGWFQVHGHRNLGALPVLASARSINLEDGVEYGGCLRAAVLDANGWTPISISNPVFTPFIDRRHRHSDIVPRWMRPEFYRPGGTILDPALSDQLSEHKGVAVRAMGNAPHVSSYAFTKKVFYDRSWDDVVVKARGLFVNNESGEIVSRAYEKFFNEGEGEDHSIESLKARLTFPLTLWIKENGFLGILGYDSKTDSLFPSSKSMSTGDFSDLFNEILLEAIPDEGKRERLKRFLRDTESSMAFEVIDPIKDPHIVEYERRGIVLLDLIRRSTEFEKMDYPQLKRLAKEFGLPVKQQAMKFNNWEAFEGWLKRSSMSAEKHIEGYVVEDASGFQFKRKLPWYDFWKSMRWVKDTVAKEIETGAESIRLNGLEERMAARGLGYLGDEAVAFRDWCRSLRDPDLTKRDIISLRNEFIAAKNVRDVPGEALKDPEPR
jgi:predicted kinase